MKGVENITTLVLSSVSIEETFFKTRGSMEIKSVIYWEAKTVKQFCMHVCLYNL